MADFQNTIDLLGDEAVTKALVERTITEFNDDIITTVGLRAFLQCTALVSVDLPNVTDLKTGAFSSCTALTRVNLPLCNPNSSSFGFFEDCSSLQSIDMPSAARFGSDMFKGCAALNTVILRKETRCILASTGAFSSTPFASGNAGGTLIVPRALVTEYPNATNWSALFANNPNNRVLALEDYTVDGTITGEIDWDKLNGGTT